MNLKIPLLAGCGVTFFGTILSFAFSISKDKTLEDKLNGLGKKPLDFDSEEDDKLWDQLIAKYLDTNTLDKIEKITEVDIKEPKENNQKSRTSLKNRCKQLIKTAISTGDEFEKIKTMAINWCTKGSPLLNKTQESK